MRLRKSLRNRSATVVDLNLCLEGATGVNLLTRLFLHDVDPPPSVLGQFAVHIVTLIYISNFVHRFEEREDRAKIDLEKEFEPSLLNSAIYLLQLIQQISTFAVNYQGRPFREALSENKAMFYGIVGVSGLAFVCSTEFIPEINESMKLVPFSEEFKTNLTAAIASSLGAD